jgi:hypothetical protein
MKFHCPECGSSYYQISTDGKTGFCLGNYISGLDQYAGCDFTWKRPEEDNTVFIMRTKLSSFGKKKLEVPKA